VSDGRFPNLPGGVYPGRDIAGAPTGPPAAQFLAVQQQILAAINGIAVIMKGTAPGGSATDSLVVGSPSGGNMGPGSINCSELYINGQRPGQYASAIVPSAGRVTLTSGVAANIATVTLAPGEWSLGGEVWINIDAGTPSIQGIAGSIGAVSGRLPSDPADDTAYNVQEINQSRSAGSLVGFILPLSGLYLDLTAATIYYLIAQATWTGGGTISAYGKIAGRVLPF